MPDVSSYLSNNKEKKVCLQDVIKEGRRKKNNSQELFLVFVTSRGLILGLGYAILVPFRAYIQFVLKYFKVKYSVNDISKGKMFGHARFVMVFLSHQG